MADKPMWMVRAGEGACFIEDFRSKSIVAIGWADADIPLDVKTREQIADILMAAFSDYSRRQALTAAGQIYRFRCEITIGHRVITYDPNTRTYLIGTIKGEPVISTTLIPDMTAYRTVDWDGEVARDPLSVPTKNTLGAIQALFQVSDDAAAELEAFLAGQPPRQQPLSAPVTNERDLLEDMQGRSQEFIKDKISKLEWDEVQELVAGVLRAMGYKTRVSAPGPDRGKDIVASRDGLGFEPPRIVVEVKHRKGTMGAEQIRSFIGGRHAADKGLYVSTGGFTREAQYEADRATIPIALMNLDELVRVITDYYEKMDPDTRALLPLTKIYWPA